MKKISYVLGTILLCLLNFTGCGQEADKELNTVSVYYVSNTETKVEQHEYALQSNSKRGQVEELLACLGTIPEKLEYKAPLSMGFQVLDVKMNGGKVQLNVDEAYNKLSVTTEVLVRAAIVRTLTQIDGVSFVGITVEGEQLYDNTGSRVGWMSADQFIDNDGNEINTYELVRVRLYFANEAGDQLIAAYREKHYSTNTPLERFVVDEVLAGPSGQIEGMYPTVNPETKVINVMTRDGICYVNLDSNFLTMINNVTLDTAIYSLVNSLVELSNVNKVQILVNGEVPANFTTTVYETNLDHVTTLE
jgi:germination protein M